MVSKKGIKEYGFQTIDQYYEYVIQSKINGQVSQAINLIEKMSKEQKRSFLIFLNGNDFWGDVCKWCKQKTIELL